MMAGNHTQVRKNDCPHVRSIRPLKTTKYFQMRKILIAAILPVLLFACAKEEKTNVQFRTPTCADTTDDGIFEAYTSSETAELLRYHGTVPDSPDRSYIAFNNITSHVLYNNAIIYDPVFQYKQNKPAQVYVYLPYEVEKYYSWTNYSGDTTNTLNIPIYNARLMHLVPGCYRIYYIFSAPNFGTIYSKGHYDIEIK